MKMDGEVKNFFEGSDRYLKAKKFAKNKNGKIKPVYEIGALGGKNFKGYQVVYNKNLSKTPAPKKKEFTVLRLTNLNLRRVNQKQVLLF